jgi:hypothetical protein
MADSDDSQQDIWTAFREETNMPPARLERWLESAESKRVGWKGEDGKGSGESVGHASGRHIIAIKRRKKAELTPDDYAHMAKVVGYIRRHKAQRPRGDIASSDWRYSLMNWGYDPLKG